MKTFCLFILSFLLFSLCIYAQNGAAHFTAFSQYYRCGNVSVSGNQLTVEALVKLDGAGPFVAGQSANDIVSKHNGVGDANYVLRPDHCELSTTNGHYISSLTGFTSFIKDSFYHVAMTYDGSLMKFYVNGCLYNQTPATGSLITNSYTTTIGQLASNPTALAAEQLFGYADEVRIWSVVRTQSQISTNMRDIPNPAIQTGLLAYYKFEGNSNNVQGNTTFNAIPFGPPVLQIQDGFDKVKIFNASYSIQQPTCGGSNGGISVLSEGGKSPFQFSLNGGAYQSSNSFSGLPASTYLVSVKSDGLGCTKDTTISLVSQCATVGFSSPDTVCVNTPVILTNNSTGASSYYWNFCVADINTAPSGVNLGNVGSALSAPVYIDYVYDGGNYYGFQTNNFPGKLLRLNFGNSLLNTPTVTDLGTVGGIIPNNTEGVQIIKNGTNWYVIVVGGDPAGGNPSRIVKIELGTNITNNSPVGTNWGNIGSLAYPHDLYVFDENGHWYGLTVNTSNNTITRFDFTTSFSNIPSGINLGNIGTLTAPTGVYAMKDNGNWYAFITNANSSTLTRLNFGTSLLNTPTGVNLGNIGGQFNTPWDIHVMKFCGQNTGFLINASSNNLIKLDFGNSISNVPTASSFGNIGTLNFPHCLSKIFRVGADLYSFIPNVSNNTLTRLKFTGCTTSSIPNSTLQTPPPITYNSPGVYNINLTIDDGLATQSAFCKQIVVLNKPLYSPVHDTTICPGNSITLNANIQNASNISWSPATGLSNTAISNPVATPQVTTQYIVTATNAGGCSISDTVVVTVLTTQQCTIINVIPSFTTPDTVCVNAPVNIVNATAGASSFYWNFCVANINNPPTAINLGNPGNTLSQPVFMDLAEYNGNYYAFVVNHYPGGITRLDYGNSWLNNPIAVSIGNPGNALNSGYGSEGIQIVKANGKWYGIVVGGNPTAPGSVVKLVIISFGTNLTNASPTAIDYGNIGNMLQSIDLHVFQENGIWYGFTVNAVNNTITRFNFTNSFDNAPTAVNLGNIGNLDYPTGVYALNDNGFWRVFVTNGNTNSTLTRLDFGSSLLNVPTGVNLGNPGNQFVNARDITILRYCGQTVGFVTNANNNIIRLNFNSITAAPTATNLGNLGNLDFSHSLSKLFRVGNDIYSFVANVNNNTITRLKFSGCNNSSLPSSTLQNPPLVTYSTPGNYYINLTVDDGLPTQTAFCKQVVVVAVPVQLPTQTFTICSGSSIKFGSNIHSGSFLWNNGATTDSISVNLPGTYWVESGGFGCIKRDSFIVNVIKVPFDFGFQQNSCNPKTVQFTGSFSGLQSFQWDFGNTQTNSTSQTPAVSYTNYGSYTIKLKVQYASGCFDSLQKTILIDDVYNNSLVFNNDTTICLGDSILLKTNPAVLHYCWQSSAGTNPTSLNTYVKPITTTTYVLNSQVSGTNLVVNGNFSGGNSGFSSDYIYAFPNLIEGQYWVGPNPSSWNGGISNCPDHTSGSGNLLAVNGSPAANAKIWSQTVAVSPNTNYNFSAWLESLSSTNPANLQFSINNVSLGNSIGASSNTCQWNQFFSSWNSGSSTSATITIINNNTVAAGNDFALDDIFFGTVTTQTDSFTVNITGLCDSIKITGPNKVCSRNDTLTYSIYKSPNCTQQFTLQVDNNYANIISQTASSLKLVFKKNGTTPVKVLFNNTCKVVVDSINVQIKFSPGSINFGPDINSCRDTSLTLNAGEGFNSYLWQNNSTDSTFSVNGAGTYYVLAQNICGLQLKDTLRVVRAVSSPFTFSPSSVAVCAGDSVQFNASGGSVYSWSPASNFSSPNSANTKALIDLSQNFTLFISDPACLRDTTIVIPVTASAGAAISISKSNDVDCSTDSAVLKASGGLSYTWTPNLFITRTAPGQITVKPPQTQTYLVTGIDAFGCIETDTVSVVFTAQGDQKLFMPTAFTPNGDGLNEIFRPTFTGPAKNYQFSIYNRWGQLIFKSTVPGVGWDGNFRSMPQPKDVYVYYVTTEGGCNGKFVQKGTFVLIR